EPLAGELGVTWAVEAALNKIHVTGQVVAGDPRGPRGLLEVWPAEGVHPPDEWRDEVRGAVAPDELQAGETFEYPLGDHVHLVVQVVERHEADVLLVGAGVAGRGRRIGDSRSDLDVRGDRKARIDRRFPEWPELRFAVDLPGLQRDADLDHARVCAPLVDLFQRTA